MDHKKIQLGKNKMKSHLKIFKQRPISPSCLSLWEDAMRDPDHKQWGKYYIEGIKREVSELEQARMDFGTEIHNKIATNPKFLPKVPRYDTFEEEIKVNLWGIPLVGKIDTLSANLSCFADYKTTQSKTWWDKKQAQKSIQFLMYFALLYLKFDINPSNITCKVVVIHIDENEDGTRKLNNKVEIFNVKHNLVDVINFLSYLKKTYKDMCKFVKNYKVV